MQVVMVFGGGYLLWRLRAKLPLVAVAYGFCALVVLVFSGALSSVHRYHWRWVCFLGVILVEDTYLWVCLP